MSTSINRDDLEKLFKGYPRFIRFLTDLFSDTGSANQAAYEAQQTANGAVQSTTGIQNATVLTLSPNSSFNAERVLTAGSGITLTDTGPNKTLVIATSGDRITVVGNFKLTLRISADTDLTLPVSGTLATLDLGDVYADDASAAAGNVAVGQSYKRSDGLIAWRQI